MTVQNRAEPCNACGDDKKYIRWHLPNALSNLGIEFMLFSLVVFMVPTVHYAIMQVIRRPAPKQADPKILTRCAIHQMF